MKFRLLDRINDLEGMLFESRKAMRECGDPEVLKDLEFMLKESDRDSYVKAERYYKYSLIEAS